VITLVRVKAQSQGLDPAVVEGLWRQLIDWSIAREELVLGADPATKAE
jgi:isochorismate pyruvate lyase